MDLLSTITKHDIVNILRADGDNVADHFKAQLKDFPTNMRFGISPATVKALEEDKDHEYTELFMIGGERMLTCEMPTFAAHKLFAAVGGSVSVMVPNAECDPTH